MVPVRTLLQAYLIHRTCQPARPSSAAPSSIHRTPPVVAARRPLPPSPSQLDPVQKGSGTTNLSLPFGRASPSMQQGKPFYAAGQALLCSRASLLNSRMNTNVGTLREPFSRLGSACRQLVARFSCVSRVSWLLFFPDRVRLQRGRRFHPATLLPLPRSPDHVQPGILQLHHIHAAVGFQAVEAMSERGFFITVRFRRNALRVCRTGPKKSLPPRRAGGFRAGRSPIRAAAAG